MKKSVSVITNALFEKLPHDLPFYTQDGLVQYGLPPFLVKRISQIVYLRILEKVSLPDETWLNRESDVITDAWHDLTGAIKQELRIPSGIMKEVMERSVRDCLELTIQPRRAIGKYLFGHDHELDVARITERASLITVNRYLVWSLIRYMEKKEKDKIDREQADRILEKIDDKVVENYHPLNWLALVKPLFELCGPTVPTDLLRLFFEDKNQNLAAKEFDLMAAEINETQFIEVLSSPDLLYVEGYKDDQQSLFKESLEDDLEDPLHQKFMKSTEDLPEILPVDDETDIPDNIITEPDDETADEAESTAPWDDDEVEIEVKDEDDVEEQEELKTKEISDREEAVDTDVETEPMEADTPQKEGTIDPMEEDPPQKKITIASIEIDDDLDSEPDEGEDEDEAEENDDQMDRDEDLLESSESAQAEVESEPEPEEDGSLASRFMFDEGTESEYEEDQDLDEATTIYDELNLSRKGAEPSNLDLFSNPEEVTFEKKEWMSFEPDEPDDPEPVESSDSENETESESPLFVDESEFKSLDDEDMDREGDELPMWRSFLEREDVENSSSFEFDNSRYDLTEEDEDPRGIGAASPENEEEGDESALDKADTDEDSELLDEDGFIEEPIYDLTKEEIPIDQKIGDLNEWMLDEKERFVEKIFGDSEDAYEQALADIIEYNDWKSASRYIEKEIFTRNRIDVYDEISVDFTDRLHSYFLENK